MAAAKARRARARRARVKTTTRARTAMAGRARIATTSGTQPNRQHSSKADVLTVRSGVTTAQSAVHDELSRQLGQVLEFKNLSKKVKVSSRCIGAMPKITKKKKNVHTSSWCLAAVAPLRGPAGTLLVDSGADEHVCHPRVHARPLIHHVRLDAVDDIPVRLSSRSLTNWLDRRLDELALPKHGTRLDRRTRVGQREKTTCCSGESHRRRTMQNARSVPMGGEWNWLPRWPREPSKTEREVHELAHLPP